MLETAVRRATTGKRLVLAVSGGRDSMVLLDAVARVAPRSVAMVATFNHGTGIAATRASEHVARAAGALGYPVVIGHAEPDVPASEAEWRRQRLAFLHDVATKVSAEIATAHTRDDQLETVLMRVLRDAGARGLAGLYASRIVRPFLDVSRADVVGYADRVGVTWIEDPSNDSPRFLRNRVRRDLLPALTRARPHIALELLDVSRRASSWRQGIDARVQQLSEVDSSRARVAVTAAIASRAESELAVIWPALAARVGLAMDRRGIVRAAQFTRTAANGGSMQLSGGWEIARVGNRFELRRIVHAPAPTPRRLSAGMLWGGWQVAEAAHRTTRDTWAAWLPARRQLTVRPWQPGDRMRVKPGVGRGRKVQSFLSDAHISGRRRTTWPVVLVDDEIAWIPGVRHGEPITDAARTGEPGVVYRCETDEPIESVR